MGRSFLVALSLGLGLSLLAPGVGSGQVAGGEPVPVVAPAEDVVPPELPVEPAPLAAPDYATLLGQGWAAYQAGDHLLAEQRYREALLVAPGSEQARLGLTLPWMAQRRWAEVEQLTEELLRDNPDNRLAALRRALARFEQGRPAAALVEYRRLALVEPTDPEAALGIGWSELRLGHTAPAVAACQRASELAPGDPRATQCLVAAATLASTAGAASGASVQGGGGGEEPWRVRGALYGGYLAYANPVDRQDLRSLLAVFGLAGPGRLAIDLDVGHSSTELASGAAAETVDQLGAGLSWGGEEERQGVHLLQRWVGGATSSRSTTLSGQGGVNLGSWRLGAEAAASLYDGLTALQVEPSVRWTLSPRWSVGVNGRWIGLLSSPTPRTAGASAGQGPAGPRGGQQLENLLSAGALLRWVAHPRVALTLSGWGGQRRYPVDASGLVVTATAERWTGGVRLGAGTDFTDWLSGWVAAQLSFGDEQETARGVEPHDFALQGGVLGLLVRF